MATPAHPILRNIVNLTFSVNKLKLYLFQCAELISLIVSLLTAKKLWGTHFFWFIPFLALTNMVELGARFGWFTIGTSNVWVYNIFENIEFIFYAWFFSTQAAIAKKKKIFYLTAAYLCVACINIIFIQGFFNFHSYSYLLGSLFMIYLVIDFFYNLIHQQGEYIHLLKYPPFWISVGILFFYVGMFSFYVYFEFIILHLSKDYSNLFLVLMDIFNIVLYGCFSIAFLCPKQPVTIR